MTDRLTAAQIAEIEARATPNTWYGHRARLVTEDIPALVRDLRAAREDVAAVREAMLALADAAHAAGNVLFNLKQDAGPGAALTADARESCRAAQEGIDTAHARVQRAYAQTNQRAARAALPEETPNG